MKNGIFRFVKLQTNCGLKLIFKNVPIYEKQAVNTQD